MALQNKKIKQQKKKAVLQNKKMVLRKKKIKQQKKKKLLQNKNSKLQNQKMPFDEAFFLCPKLKTTFQKIKK